MNEAILTFDLEDWFQLTARRFRMSGGRVTSGRLRSQVLRILDVLSANDARATFFVLGKTAAVCPEVVKDVTARGHEIASHGFGHELVRSLTPQAFRADVQASVSLLQDLSGKNVFGYRAPEFSIDPSSFWAFDVLLDCGIKYDSSVFPIRGPRYGIPDAPLVPHRVRTPSGRHLLELPLAVLDILGQRLPVAGGGYWRLLPGSALEWALGRVSRSRSPMLYFHPAEFDRRALNLSLRSLDVFQFVVKQNLGRSSVAGKLDSFLKGRRCTSAGEFIARLCEGDLVTYPAAA